jgi:hypothetical protein
MQRTRAWGRWMVVACLVAALGLPGTPSAVAEDGAEASRSWMGAFLLDAEGYGYRVTGLSPASSRFIPSTPYAAFKLQGPLD